ncbi:MAG: tungstate ABC transporter substrate-binding protein WtpA [Crenarchaeota archaeon]|nr:tungstate ABC transporter substrate-binding protein WtpA [Thermoproteota archaeon]
MRRYIIIAIVIGIVIAIIAGIAYYYSTHKHREQTLKKTQISTGTYLRIFCAGSLTIPFQDIAQVFEKKYGVTVHIEPSGSVMAVRKITDLHEWCDVLGVSDYRLIPKFMIPRYAKWCIGFATNQIVLAFTNHSRYATYLIKHPQDWYKILMMKNVRYGFSNPNMDPCGYRAVGVIALAALYYHNITILKDLVISKISGAKYRLLKNGTLIVYIPATFTIEGRRLVIRPKEVDLVSLLESGDIDYAFEYKSVAIQHHLLYITLPPQLNLGNPDYAKYYSRVIVKILVGTPEEKSIKMAPIIYGITIPTVTKHEDLAIKFVELILSETGRRIFAENGQNILKKLIIVGTPPDWLMRFLRETGYSYVVQKTSS